MAKNAMPVSKAKTAYGLLSEIRKLILEEPKRYDQMTTARRPSGTEKAHGLAPECGTVGCVAGWVYLLKARRGVSASASDQIDYAEKKLGLGEVGGIDTWELFSEMAAGGRMDYDHESIQAHAKRGAAHIAKFQKKYAAQLKAKRV